MEEILLGLLVAGFLVLVLFGSVLAIVNLLRLQRLERSLAQLAAKVAGLEGGRATAPAETAADGTVAEETAAGETVTGETVTESTQAAAAPSDDATASQRTDLESRIAGRWLNRIGIFAVMLAVAFFLKFAFDNDWVGPMGRVAIGLVAGTGLVFASQWFLTRGYRYFSEGIAALGAGVLYLSLFAAWEFYELIPQWAAFGGMVVVTAAFAGLAMGRDSQRLALLALGAGLTTPGLLGTVTDWQIPLFTYLAVLVAAFLLLAWRKGWRWVAPLALLGTVGYFAVWCESFYAPRKLVRTVAFATLFFAEFGACFWLRVRSGPPLRNAELLLVPANAAWYGITLHLLLYQDHRWWLTGAVLLLGVLHLMVARRIEGLGAEGLKPMRLLLAGLALSFGTAAVPIRLEGEWIPIALAVEAAVLVWAGFRTDIVALRLAGLGLLAAVVSLVLLDFGGAGRPFLNERFVSFMAVAGALAASAWWGRQNEGKLLPRERPLFSIAAVAGNAMAILGLSEEVWYALGQHSGALEPRLARQMGLSLLWAVAASLLIFLGVRKGSKALRWQGLVLLGFTILKVFLIDLSFLERAYRIASFLVLGIALLVVSFWYQRSLAEARAPEDPEGEEENR